MRFRNNPVVKVTIHSSEKKQPQQSGFERLQQQCSELAIDALKQLPSFTAAVQEYFKGEQYRVILSPEARNGLKTGTVQWSRRGNDLVAVLQDSKTKRFSEQAQIEKMSGDWMNLVQQLINQQMLMEIMGQLDEVQLQLSEVVRFQKNNRLAQLNKGVERYHQSIISIVSDNRKEHLSDAISCLIDAKHQYVLALEDGIGDFHSSKPLKHQASIQKAHDVQTCFQATLKASQFLILVYDAQGETESVKKELKFLRDFVLRVGDEGSQIAQRLPYDEENPPEDIWRGAFQN